MQSPPRPSQSEVFLRVAQVIRLFLLLGSISFGGPAASIAFMDQEVVEKRGWVSRPEFMALLATTNLVPGPNAVEMAIHIGYKHSGWFGLVSGGVAFILPAALISLVLAVVYQQYGMLPQVQSLFYGIYPVVLAIILQATYRLGRSAIKDWKMILLAVACLAAAWLRVNEVVIILAAGIVSLVLEQGAPRLPLHLLSLALLPILQPVIGWFDAIQDRLVQLILFFLKVGALLFGSGMVLFAFIQNDVVNGYGWLSQQQLLDAITVGQVTPGPVLSSATFIGYLVAGYPGALAATVAVFLPAFGIIAAISPWLPKIAQYAPVKSFMKGINVAVVAIILMAAVKLGNAAIQDLRTGLMGIASLIILLRYKISSMWLILGGAALGLILLQLP
jgi:chromate transporter